MEQLTKVRVQFLTGGFVLGLIVLGGVWSLTKQKPPPLKKQKPSRCADVTVTITTTGAQPDDFDLCASDNSRPYSVIWEPSSDIKGCTIHFDLTPFDNKHDFDCDKNKKSGPGKCDTATACYYKYSVTISQQDGASTTIDPGGSVWQ